MHSRSGVIVDPHCDLMLYLFQLSSPTPSFFFFYQIRFSDCCLQAEYIFYKTVFVKFTQRRPVHQQSKEGRVHRSTGHELRKRKTKGKKLNLICTRVHFNEHKKRRTIHAYKRRHESLKTGEHGETVYSRKMTIMGVHSIAAKGENMAHLGKTWRIIRKKRIAFRREK